MKVAVTGANGFIGTHLCKLLLRKGYSVVSIVLDHTHSKQLTTEQRICDITDEETTVNTLADVDIVIHLAAVSDPTKCSEDFDYAYQINVEGTKNVIRAAAGKRLIFASTSHVYGNPVTNGTCSENDPLKGRSQYAITKIMCEVLCNNYSFNYNHNISIIRLFNIFGENQDKKYLIPNLIEQALSRGKITVRRMQLVRDFLYVGDAITAILTVMEKGHTGEVYNIGSGVGTEISKIVGYISSIASNGTEMPAEDLNIISQEPLILIANIEKIKRLGWRPRHSLVNGLQRTIEFYRKLRTDNGSDTL